MAGFFQVRAWVFAVALTLGAGVRPHSADAVVGGALGLAPVVVAGGVLAATAGSVGLGALVLPPWNSRNAARRFVLFFSGTALALVGVVILPAESPSQLPAFRFQPLSPSEYTVLGVSEEDAAVYASEIEELNAAWDAASAQAFRELTETPELAQAYFTREFQSLSPETRRVLSAVGRAAQLQLFNGLNESE